MAGAYRGPGKMEVHAINSLPRRRIDSGDAENKIGT